MKKYLAGLSLLVMALSSCNTNGKIEDNMPITPVPFTGVRVTDDFWGPKIEINHRITIPIAIEQSTITGRIKNFEIAGGLAEGEFCSIYPFDDSDVFKIIEGASYSLQTFPDPDLEATIDSLIIKIGLAQEEDGYIYTYRTIMGDDSHPWVGKRWEKTHILSHELYNLGHMYEAAVAHYQATGKSEFLDIALKSAELVDNDFGWGKFESYPGHQEIEIGLVKLYRATGDRKYLNLAKFFLDVRGPDGEEYSQSHQKVVDQDKAVGHSVRAGYMYTGMADVAALTEDEAYVDAISKIWKDIVHSKMYVTGGIGASGGNEGFGDPFNLPNMSAYCETCASIANVLWNHRMFLHHGESKYLDVLERTLYNALLSGVSLSGDRFFYPNVLESTGRHERQAWFGCACCPSNITRFIPSVPGYVYARRGDEIFINMYLANTGTIDMDWNEVTITQTTNYPWSGDISIQVDPAIEARYTIKLRIPGWAREEAIPGDLYIFTDAGNSPVVIRVNGKKKKLDVSGGYANITRKWKKGDRMELELPMPVRKVIADERVEADNDRFAVQRGPLIFCAEWPDNPEGNILNLVFGEEAEFNTEFNQDILNGTQIIITKGRQVKRNLDGEIETSEIQDVTLIPYHLWNNRGPGQMMVWLPQSNNAARPFPAPTIANRSRVTDDKEFSSGVHEWAVK
ncbi:MAG TPA: glycoside hydrolase family 127 protein [Bacteroidales bacterium]|nr:glycoside hydrolase family 127 protein [Bacteroidales bacterium]